MCKSFHSTGYCPYGTRCHFIHDSKDEISENSENSEENNEDISKSLGSLSLG